MGGGGQNLPQRVSLTTATPSLALPLPLSLLLSTMTTYGVYILKCADGSYYTGLTNDLTKRLATHNAGKGAKFTRSRLPVMVVFWLDHLSRRAAYRVEYAIKQLTRRQKMRLIQGDAALVARIRAKVEDG